MVTHVVLYRPKPGLEADAGDRFAQSIVIARREISAIRRFTVGRRIQDGPSYARGPFPDYPYIAMIEFEDRGGLLAYLQHPMHASLGQQFGASVEAALVYDFHTVDAADAARVLPAGAQPPPGCGRVGVP